MCTSRKREGARERDQGSSLTTEQPRENTEIAELTCPRGWNRLSECYFSDSLTNTANSSGLCGFRNFYFISFHFISFYFILFCFILFLQMHLRKHPDCPNDTSVIVSLIIARDTANYKVALVIFILFYFILFYFWRCNLREPGNHGTDVSSGMQPTV